MKTIHEFTYFHNISRYSFTQLSELGCLGVNENAQALKWKSRGFKPRLHQFRVWRSTAELPRSEFWLTKLDRIWNDRIRGTTNVGEISKKLQEIRSKYYGDVMRREEDYVGK